MAKEVTPIYTACAKSQDGVTWEKPDYGIIELEGSKHNNLVFDELQTTNPNANTNLWPFEDANPDARDSERYKALIPFRTDEGAPLMAVVSDDGLH